MNSKKTGNSIKVKLLIALMSVALVFTMMPLTMGNSYAEDESVVTDEQVEAVGEETVDMEEPADVDTVIEEEEDAAEPEAVVEAKSEELTAKEAEPSVLVKGNVLKQNKTVSASTLPANLLQSGIDFKGVNKNGNLSTNTVIKGVTFEALINYLGVKDGAKIEKFIVTTNKLDTESGSTAKEVTEYTYNWLMAAPDEDEFNNGKAMLAFEFDNKGTKVNTRVFLGGFSDMERVGQDKSGPYKGYPKNMPLWIDTLVSIEVVGTAPGDVFVSEGSSFAVTSATAKTAAFTKAKNAKKVTVPDTVVYKNETYKITKVNANAFKGKKIRTVTLGKNIDTIAKYAFKKSKARTLIVKTKALTKKSVKGSLKKSKIKRVKVKVGTKKENRKFVKKYRKIFKKKNSGKRVKVRR